jgi:membrane-associated phospholipid phosphatase
MWNTTRHRQMCRLVVLLAVVVSPAAPALAEPSVVRTWNAAMLQAVRDTRMAPMHVARALAIVHTCTFDAWAAYDRRAVGTRLGGALRRPAAEWTDGNKAEAISYAAYRALVDLFPTARASLFDPLMADLGYDVENRAADGTPAGIGNTACAAVVAFRHRDGANQRGDLNGGAPYSDYTGYMPVNDPWTLRDPNRWQPLLQPSGEPQAFLAAHWGRVAPFALAHAGQLRPPRPVPYERVPYEKQAREVVALSARLTDVHKAIASYWADGPATETPPGHWNLFAQWVSARDGHGIDQDVQLFFALGNALLDASIAVWECKRAFDYVRPISAIRFLYGGTPIEAWGGPYHGTRLIDGSTWEPYLPTPPFAEYVSGHSTFSAAAASVLTFFTGSRRFGLEVTVPAFSSTIEPGAVPATDVTLRWSTFDAAADEAGMSRRLGGIHFEDADTRGRHMGKRVGQLAWARARAHIEGRIDLRRAPPAAHAPGSPDH